jgi:hypothetical protein
MDRFLRQSIPVIRADTIPRVAYRLLTGYLVGAALALQRATDSPDRYNPPDQSLKFIAAQDDASIAEVRSDGYGYRLRFGAWNACVLFGARNA